MKIFQKISTIIRKFFAPEIDLLKSNLEAMRRERDYFRELLEQEKQRTVALEFEVKAEAARNRRREDALTDRILAVKQIGALPEREPETERPVEGRNAQLTSEEEAILWSRAEEIAAPDATQEEIKKLFALMRQRPEEYLTN